MDPLIASTTYALGGLTVSAVSVAGGLRLLSFRRALEVQLAAAGREIPTQVNVYVGFISRALHFTAGMFCLAVLMDLMLSRYAPSGFLSAIAAWTSIVGVFGCGVVLLLQGMIDFRVKIHHLPTRLVQVLAGASGVSLAVLGAVCMVQFGHLWQMPAS